MRNHVILDHAVCRPDWWYLFVSEDTTDQAQAKVVCAHCPVRTDCLAHYFLDQDVVVGGTTWGERTHMLNQGLEPNVVGERLRDMFSKPGASYMLEMIGFSQRLVAKLAGRYRSVP